jgi:septal ring factor EnvC (AmiA/AmiB activator)
MIEPNDYHPFGILSEDLEAAFSGFDIRYEPLRERPMQPTKRQTIAGLAEVITNLVLERADIIDASKANAAHFAKQLEESNDKLRMIDGQRNSRQEEVEKLRKQLEESKRLVTDATSKHAEVVEAHEKLEKEHKLLGDMVTTIAKKMAVAAGLTRAMHENRAADHRFVPQLDDVVVLNREVSEVHAGLKPWMPVPVPRQRKKGKK